MQTIYGYRWQKNVETIKKTILHFITTFMPGRFYQFFNSGSKRLSQFKEILFPKLVFKDVYVFSSIYYCL